MWGGGGGGGGGRQEKKQGTFETAKEKEAITFLLSKIHNSHSIARYFTYIVKLRTYAYVMHSKL
jgi:hypothetical protein